MEKIEILANPDMETKVSNIGETLKQVTKELENGERRGARQTIKNVLTAGGRTIMKGFNRMKGSSGHHRLLSRNPTLRGSIHKRRAAKNSTLTANSLIQGLKVKRAALVIINAKYSCDDYCNLQGVKDDGDNMMKMLSNHHFKVEIVSDVPDIGKATQTFCKKYEGADILHVHYSGHGLDSATIQFDPNSYTKDKDGKRFDTKAAVGDCMVGSGPDGDLYSVHDMKHELVGSKPGKVVMTLDCCRDKRGAGKQFVTLSHTRKMSTSDQQKIAVIHGTSELHTASDSNSFTKELYKIYKEEKKAIPFLEIVRRVNQSWQERGVSQTCKFDIVEIGNNWKSFIWPAPDIIENTNMTNSENTMANFEVLGEEREKGEKYMKKGQSVTNLSPEIENDNEDIHQNSEHDLNLRMSKMEVKIETLEEKVGHLAEENLQLKTESDVLCQSEDEKAKRKEKMRMNRKSREMSSPSYEDLASFCFTNQFKSEYNRN